MAASRVLLISCILMRGTALIQSLNIFGSHALPPHVLISLFLIHRSRTEFDACETIAIGPTVRSSQECEVQRPGLGMPYCADDCAEQSSVYFTSGCADGQSCCVSRKPVVDGNEPVKPISPVSPPHVEESSSSKRNLRFCSSNMLYTIPRSLPRMIRSDRGRSETLRLENPSFAQPRCCSLWSDCAETPLTYTSSLKIGC